MIIRIEDVRKAGYCVRGARDWARDNGFNFSAFLRDGIEADDLETNGDAMSLRVIALKRQRENSK